MNAFRQALDQARDADLVDHLGQLAGAGRAEPLAHPRIGRDHRLGAGIGIFRAAAHHRQHAVFRAGLAAGHRRIDELESSLGRRGVELARDLGGSRGVVDEGRAFLHAGEGAVGAERDRAQIIVVADAAHHEILAFGGGLRRRRGAAAELVGPFLRLRRRAVVHRHLWPPFFTRCPAMGKPITPRPRKATLAMCATLSVASRLCLEVSWRFAGGRFGPDRCPKEGAAP